MSEEQGPSGKRPPTSEEILAYTQRELPRALSREGKVGVRRTMEVIDGRLMHVTIAKPRAKGEKIERAVPPNVAVLSDVAQRVYLALERLRAEYREDVGIWQLQIHGDVGQGRTDHDDEEVSLRQVYRVLDDLIGANAVRKSDDTGFHIGGVQPLLPFEESDAG